MKKALQFLQEALRALLTGAAIGLIAGLAALFIGALVGGWTAGLTAARSLLLLGGGFVLIYAAVLVLRGGNLPTDTFRWLPYKADDPRNTPKKVVFRRFTLCPAVLVVLLVAFGILSIGSLCDLLLR